MEMVWTIIVWIVFGIVAGANARLLVPGKQPIGLLGTMILGIVGSFLGGFAAYVFFGGEPLQASGWIGSIIGAIVVLVIWVSFAKRRGTTV